MKRFEQPRETYVRAIFWTVVVVWCAFTLGMMFGWIVY